MKDILLKVMTAEKIAIEKMIEKTQHQYAEVLEALSACKGKVVFMGIGKSGHIGQKLAATFSSTGTPAFFVHAAESVHGDMGMVEKEDIVILISNSGTTKEVTQNLPGLKKIGCKTVAFTSAEDSFLAQNCDYKLIYPKCDEADHLNLAPTVSSTLALVLGDSLACALSEQKKFTKEDFYKYHPSGALGQKLSKEVK